MSPIPPGFVGRNLSPRWKCRNIPRCAYPVPEAGASHCLFPQGGTNNDSHQPLGRDTRIAGYCDTSIGGTGFVLRNQGGLATSAPQTVSYWLDKSPMARRRSPVHPGNRQCTAALQDPCDRVVEMGMLVTGPDRGG